MKAGGTNRHVWSLLESCADASVEGDERFAAWEKFCEGKTIDGVKIDSVGPSFRNRYLGKTERSVRPANLFIRRIKDKKRAFDSSIVQELGDVGETFLSDLWNLLKCHGSGEEGGALSVESPNLIYVRDRKGNIGTVYASWQSNHEGWCIGSNLVERHAGCRVIFLSRRLKSAA